MRKSDAATQEVKTTVDLTIYIVYIEKSTSPSGVTAAMHTVAGREFARGALLYLDVVITTLWIIS